MFGINKSIYKSRRAKVVCFSHIRTRILLNLLYIQVSGYTSGGEIDGEPDPSIFRTSGPSTSRCIKALKPILKNQQALLTLVQLGR